MNKLSECVESVDVDKTLHRVSKFLIHLSKEAEEIEGAISSLVGSADTQTGGPVSSLQKVDFLRQSLKDIGGLLGRVQSDCSLSCHELIQSCTLDSTKALVAGQSAAHDADFSRHESQVELF